MFEQMVVATEDVPTGENLILSASFDKDGEDPPGVATGILSLYHGDRKVGEARIKNQPGYFELAGEGLCVGRDSGAAVTDDYPGERPYRFTGGTIWSARPRPCSPASSGHGLRQRGRQQRSRARQYGMRSSVTRSPWSAALKAMSLLRTISGGGTRVTSVPRSAAITERTD
jgi:hypothetical protein